LFEKAQVVIATAMVYHKNSQQWPLLLMFLSPVALVFVVMLLFRHSGLSAKQ
jgi:hypothetical protein